MNKHIWTIGFTLFAMLFGAGNLIFLPNLGQESGAYFWLAILAFCLTGIGLPLLGVVVEALDRQGYIGVSNKLSPRFSVVFLIIIYLTIGPLFVMPRTASTSFEMTTTPITHSNSNMSSFISTLIYLIIVLYLCINPGKIVDRIGSLLTPLLLIIILAVIIKGSVDYKEYGSPHGSPETYSSNIESFFHGFTEGYLAMNAIAATAFLMIVVNATKTTGVKHTNQIFKQTIIVGFIAALALISIYAFLEYIGNHMEVSQDTITTLMAKNQNIGTYLLTTMTTNGFGVLGKYLLDITVALVCLATACELIVSVGQYFNSIFLKISYKAYVVGFIAISFVLVNLGLNPVIDMSVPVLSITYPITITMITLILFARFIPIKPIAQQISIIIVNLVSIVNTINTLGLIKLNVINHLPLKQHFLKWLPIAVVSTTVGYVVSKFINQPYTAHQKE